MQEDRPLFLNRIAENTEPEKQLAVRIFEECLEKLKRELDNLIANESGPAST